MSNRKSTRPKLSKAQLAEQARQIQEAQKGKKLVREVLFPVLKKHATSINNAERQTQIFKTVILMNLQKPFKDKKVGELDFSEEIENEKDPESAKIFTAFLKAFADVQIADAIRLLQDFEGGVQAYFQNEARTRKFSSLKVEDLIGE